MKFKNFIAKKLNILLVIITQIDFRINPIKFFTEEETREKIKEGYSISRFGDGEINLILKKSSISFQKIDDTLSDKLKEVLSIDMKENVGFAVALVPMMGTYKEFNKKQVQFWACFNASKRHKVIKLLNRQQRYYDPLFARLIGYKEKSKIEFYSKLNSLQGIWENKKIVIVEGQDTRLGVNNDLLYLAQAIRRVIVPAQNAYGYYELIKEYVLQLKEYDLVLLVIGPTATVMAYDLYKEGIQAIDLGQVNDSYRMAIQYYEGGEKYRNIILTESEYRNQIIQNFLSNE